MEEAQALPARRSAWARAPFLMKGGSIHTKDPSSPTCPAHESKGPDKGLSRLNPGICAGSGCPREPWTPLPRLVEDPQPNMKSNHQAHRESRRRTVSRERVRLCLTSLWTRLQQRCHAATVPSPCPGICRSLYCMSSRRTTREAPKPRRGNDMSLRPGDDAGGRRQGHLHGRSPPARNVAGLWWTLLGPWRAREVLLLGHWARRPALVWPLCLSMRTAAVWLCSGARFGSGTGAP